MFNRKRTQEVFGYDIDPSVHRRSNSDFTSAGEVNKKDLIVVDNCPSCNAERQIKLRQSRKNKLCLKCFHNTPEMLEAKRNQVKEKSEETRKKMRENHWSRKGIESAFKGQQHSNETKQIIAKNAYTQSEQLRQQVGEEEFRIMMSLRAQGGLTRDRFGGFISPENTLIRQSVEGKAWSHDVLAKSNFTCVKCGQRGGKLHAHHKNAFASFPEQRFDTNNGACLCEECHFKFHSFYGKGDNTAEQFEEWLKK